MRVKVCSSVLRHVMPSAHMLVLMVKYEQFMEIKSVEHGKLEESKGFVSCTSSNTHYAGLQQLCGAIHLGPQNSMVIN
jgi:hypothetical protein